ncbi:MAG: GDP-L-fucose synthase [Prochlorococcus marinus CUG1438]|nr:GDP-L-fucose synthase [Prochlorococcus marinus CUG1438]|tara:strand:+ start:76 stop:1092 length:1017 start_codon:yes stop_codon:yes gene_type:complete
MKYKFNLNERIFIAGSTGMVGSAIKRELIKAGYDDTNKEGNLLTPTRKELDLENYYSVRNWYKENKPTIVIIAAAKVGGIFANNNQPYDFLLENLKIQTNLIEVSWQFEVKCLIFLGSSCIYPKFAKQPIKEEYLLTDTLEKTNEFYALAKIAGIKLCQALRKQHNFNAIALMPSNLYGPGDNYHKMNSHVIPALIRKFYDGKKNNLKKVTCWGSGNPLREFLYVDDLAEACLFILGIWNRETKLLPLDNEGDQIYWLNVGSKFEVSIKELANVIANTIEFEGEIVWDQKMPDGTPRKKLDTKKINNLGWEAKTNLQKGISLTLKHFEKEIDNESIRI